MTNFEMNHIQINPNIYLFNQDTFTDSFPFDSFPKLANKHRPMSSSELESITGQKFYHVKDEKYLV